MGIKARDLMQKEVGVVESTASLVELERALHVGGVSGLPVVEGGRLVGVVTRADVIRKLAEGSLPPAAASSFYAERGGPEAQELLQTFAKTAAGSGTRAESLSVRDVMSRSIVAVAPDDDLAAVARALAEHGVHRVLVVEGAALAGIVSSLDIVRLVAEGKLSPARARQGEG